MPKTLITDPNRDTSTYNPTGQATSACKQKTIQTKETQGLYEKNTKCGHQRSSDKQHSIHKESQLTNMNYTKRGTRKPNPKKFLFPGLYTTV